MQKFQITLKGRNTTLTIFADNKREAIKRVLSEIGPIPMELHS